MSGRAKRIMLTVSYDGTAYAGWQRQVNAMSVQQRIEEALKSLTGENIVIVGASRTDAGVHALGQAAHFECASNILPDKYSFALNTRLPGDIRVIASKEVEPAFHARYGAAGKTYRYQIHNSPHASAMYRNHRAHVIPHLDAERMRTAARDIIGEHDFRAFAASGSEAKSTVRDIQFVSVQQHDELIEITVRGRSFLYNMVRILAGGLIYIGMGKLPQNALRVALQSGNRLDLGITAPAHGLTLVSVYYKEGEPPRELRSLGIR